MEPVVVGLGIAALFLLASGGESAAPTSKGPIRPDVQGTDEDEAVSGIETFAPIVGGVVGSIVPGVGTAAGSAAGTGLSLGLKEAPISSQEKLEILSTPVAAPAILASGQDKQIGTDIKDLGSASHIEKSLDDITKVKL
jgi:hypothetical protein